MRDHAKNRAHTIEITTVLRCAIPQTLLEHKVDPGENSCRFVKRCEIAKNHQRRIARENVILNKV